MHHFPHTAPHSPRPSRPREDGFTLIEMLIVLVILAVLMAIAIPTFFGAKSSARYREAVVAADTYKQAIASYQLDNGNLAPPFSGWRAGTGGAGTMGPVNTLVPGGRPYLTRGEPDDVAAKRTTIVQGASAGSCPGGSFYSCIVYNANVTSYQLLVYSRMKLSDSWTATSTKACFLGNTAPPSGLNKC